MAYRWTGISEGTATVEADDLMEGIARSELFVNQGIGAASYRDSDTVLTDESRPNHETDGFIVKRHIFKPDFYAAPAPRMEAVSSQVHWRTTGHSHPEGVIFTPTNSGEGYVTIPGTATRLKMRDHGRAHFLCTFYCFEFGGLALPKGVGGDNDSAYFKLNDQVGGEIRRAGTVALSIHGKDGFKSAYLSSTKRDIYTSTLFPRGSDILTSETKANSGLQAYGFCLLNMLGRHQHSIMYTTSFEPGIYDIGLSFSSRAFSEVSGYADVIINGELDVGGVVRKNKTVFFMARNMVCDVVYDQRAEASEELDAWRTLNSMDPQDI